MRSWDVIVVGGGNAGSAPRTRRASGRRGCWCWRRRPQAGAGGQLGFTAGAFRVAHGGVDALAAGRARGAARGDRAAALPGGGVPRTSPGHARPMRPGDGGAARGRSADAVRLAGARWHPLAADVRAPVLRARRAGTFWGGLALGTVDGGEGLIGRAPRAAGAPGVELRYGGGRGPCATTAAAWRASSRASAAWPCCAPAPSCSPRAASRPTRERARGTWAELGRAQGARHADATRARCWRLALRHGAARHGDWGGCHSDRLGRRGALRAASAAHQPLSRQPIRSASWSTRRGERFLDEGEDFRNYTYAKYGREILRQPEAGAAFQLFDARTRRCCARRSTTAPGRDGVARTRCAALADGAGDRRGRLERTVAAFNAAIAGGAFDPAVKDGRRAEGSTPPKSNWALAMEEPPYYALRRRPAGSRSRSAACTSTRRRACSTRTGGRSPGCSRPASWSAGCSSTTTPVARGSRRASYTGVARGGPPLNRRGSARGSRAPSSSPRAARA